jgi:hypothetical protein
VVTHRSIITQVEKNRCSESILYKKPTISQQIALHEIKIALN